MWRQTHGKMWKKRHWKLLSKTCEHFGATTNIKYKRDHCNLKSNRICWFQEGKDSPRMWIFVISRYYLWSSSWFMWPSVLGRSSPVPQSFDLTALFCKSSLAQSTFDQTGHHQWANLQAAIPVFWQPSAIQAPLAHIWESQFCFFRNCASRNGLVAGIAACLPKIHQ